MKKFFEENKFYIISMLIIFGLNAFFYFIIKKFIPEYNLIGSWIDDSIPLIPIFIVPYSLWYPYLIVSYFIVYKKDVNKFKNLISITSTSLIIAFICFITYPSMVRRPVVDSFDSLITLILYITYKTDIPVNCFPSVHCLLSFVIMFFVVPDKDLDKRFRIVVGLMSTLIVFSTLFVKQHVIIDVLGALTISSILFINHKKINFFK